MPGDEEGTSDTVPCKTGLLCSLQSSRTLPELGLYLCDGTDFV
jgi:hypothetical protein